MTGGLAYLSQDDLDESTCNLDFVNLAPCSSEEDQFLRRVLIKHCLMTGSPRGAALLNSGAPLPMVRLEPRQLPCPIDETWAPILEHLMAPAPPTGNSFSLEMPTQIVEPALRLVHPSVEADPDHWLSG
jgi:hypothetical protein